MGADDGQRQGERFDLQIRESGGDHQRGCILIGAATGETPEGGCPALLAAQQGRRRFSRNVFKEKENPAVPQHAANLVENAFGRLNRTKCERGDDRVEAAGVEREILSRSRMPGCGDACLGGGVFGIHASGGVGVATGPTDPWREKSKIGSRTCTDFEDVACGLAEQAAFHLSRHAVIARREAVQKIGGDPVA